MLVVLLPAFLGVTCGHVFESFKVSPTSGGVVPAPARLEYKNQLLYLSKDFAFDFKLDCDILHAASSRYWNIIFRMGKAKANPDLLNDVTSLKSLTIKISDQKCPKYPSIDMDESYTLEVNNNDTALLTANSVWGALRGLETFSQLCVYIDQRSLVAVRTAFVKDTPRFPHRGLMLDTSRHFLPVKYLLQNLDLMAQNKLNVFHWHLVDDQSFPYESTVFPLLSKVGAYTTNHVYSPKDVAGVIEYARLRGIRVIAEFDTPGHTQSWISLYKDSQGKTVPGPRAVCYGKDGQPSGSFGPFDPTKTSTYDTMAAFVKEAFQVFPDDYIHLGGDEVSFGCWESNPDIKQFMTNHNFTNYAQLQGYYTQQLLNLVTKTKSSAKYFVWQEVFDNGAKLNADSIVHVWKGGKVGTSGSWQNTTKAATAAGVRTIVSACWYLNYISYGIDWPKYYDHSCDPQNFGGSSDQQKLVFGGEACMWGEYVDATNVISRTWPRASAVAERLWSPSSMTNQKEFATRLEEHRCRLLERGYPVEPVNGPGWCPVEWSGETHDEL